MTHDELLAKIDANIYIDGMNNIPMHTHNALRAVVELHKPTVNVLSAFIQPKWCNACEVYLPCPTILAIEKELA